MDNVFNRTTASQFRNLAFSPSSNRRIGESKNFHSGFTILELIVVIGILGILMAVLLGTFSGSTESARSAKCEANLRNLAMGVQGYAMESSHFPFAGSADQYVGYGKDRRTVQSRGWISWDRVGAGGKYISPYSDDLVSRELSITNGTIWKSMNGARESYVCPCHQRICKEKAIPEPLWSYAMNAHFGWASKSRPFSSNGHSGKWYRSFKRSDRYLLFAELPYATSTSGSKEVFQSGDLSTGASKENDPVLQYQDCEGGGDEAIGFNHKDGKNTYANVCFADGHVERLRVPKNFSDAQAKKLTRWLCVPVDDDGKQFDVSFDGKEYKQVQ